MTNSNNPNQLSGGKGCHKSEILSVILRLFDQIETPQEARGLS